MIGKIVKQADQFISMVDVPVALLAGGLATRLQAITHDIPKAMVEVAGRPFIDHQLDLFQRHGVRRVVLCLGHLGEQVESHVGNGARYGMSISYSHDGPELLGTGGALRRALPLLGDLFWVIYGDSYVDIDFAAILSAFTLSKAASLMTVLQNDGQWDRSNVIFEEGKLICYDKHRTDARMCHVDFGVALLRRSAAERIPPARQYDLADLYSGLVAERQMIGFEVTNRFFEIGTPASLAECANIWVRNSISRREVFPFRPAGRLHHVIMGPLEVRSAVFLDRDGVLIETTVRQGVPHPPASLSEVRIVEAASRTLFDLAQRAIG